MMAEFVFVYITAKDEEEARRIAKTLVEERLAACVNIFHIRSVYRWQGKVVDDSEANMIAKTMEAKLPNLVRRVKELHSYTTPAIVWWRLDGGNEPFLNWILESVGGDKT